MIDHRVTYRIETTPVHTRLTVWINGACAGHLTAREDEVEVLAALAITLQINGATETR